MRISDWISDLCSSDLSGADRRSAGSGVYVAVHEHSEHRRAASGARAVAVRGFPQKSRLSRTPQVRGGANESSRPKSVRSEERLEGKRVSVRVDLGGRRLIKKKKKNQRLLNSIH